MKKIKVACTTGHYLPIDKIDIFPGKLKKHSEMEITRIATSIENDGLLFPLAIGKVGDKNYIIDGECTYYALQDLIYQGWQIDEVPVYFVRSNEKTIRRNMLLATSVNHCVTEASLKSFVGEDNVEELKKYAFSSGELLDFHCAEDLGLYEDVVSAKYNEKEIKEEDFLGLL